MSPASAFFSSSNRSICSTNWRSCFCAETCSVVMDPTPQRPTSPQRERCRRRRHPTGFPSLPPGEGATLAARHFACKALRSAIQRFWPEVLARGPEGWARELGQNDPDPSTGIGGPASLARLGKLCDGCATPLRKLQGELP